MTEPRQLAWVRTDGLFANAARTGATSSTGVVGVAPDVCDCCDARHVVIAAVHPSGIEVNVALDPDAALAVANAILDAHAEVRPADAQNARTS